MTCEILDEIDEMTMNAFQFWISIMILELPNFLALFWMKTNYDRFYCFAV